MTNEIRVVSSPDGGWMVALDEQSLAGFYGPDARQLAECHREVLVELLAAVTVDTSATTSADAPIALWVH